MNDLSNFAHTAHHARRVAAAGNEIVNSKNIKSLTTFLFTYTFKTKFNYFCSEGEIRVYWYVKDVVVIWAKLTQGNGRGTCCWITHILILII